MMRLERDRKLGVQTPLLLFRQPRRAVQTLLGGLRQRQHLLSHRQQLCFRLAHQCHKYLPHPPTLATEAAHHLLETVLESVCACSCSAAPLVAHSAVIDVMTWRTFFGPYTGWPHH